MSVLRRVIDYGGYDIFDKDINGYIIDPDEYTHACDDVRKLTVMLKKSGVMHINDPLIEKEVEMWTKQLTALFTLKAELSKYVFVI